MSKHWLRLLLTTMSLMMVFWSLAPAAGYLTIQAAGPQTTRASGLVSEVIGDVRVQILSETLVRIEERAPSGDFEDRATYRIVNRDDWEGADTEITEDGDTVRLATSAYTVIVPANAKDFTGIRILDAAGKTLWEYTEMPTSREYLPSPGEDVDAWAIADSPRMVPAEWGFTPQPEDNEEFTTTNGYDLTNDAPDVFVFLPAGDAMRLRKDFISLTGSTEMLPLNAFGAWDSRYYKYTQEEAEEMITLYHDTYNLPLDNLVIDTDWRQGSSGTGYDINTELFPNMEGFFDYAHSQNVHILFNDHPEPTKRLIWYNDVLAKAEIQFRFENLTRLLEMGLDNWWFDHNWWITVQALEGYTNESLGAAVYADALRAVYPDERNWVMSGADGIYQGVFVGAPDISSHHYGGITWTDDTEGLQETLYNELELAVRLGAESGLPYVSSDLGAHQTQTTAMSDAEFIKWMQFGALSPIYRPHVTSGAGLGRMPWLKGEEVTNVVRDYLNMRYRLLPVFYNLSHENYETGLPMLRRLDFYYPEYEEASRNDQYLLGEDILVAPTYVELDYGTVPSSWLRTEDGQPGLKAEYYNSESFLGNPVVTRVESNIDFDWGEASPDGKVNSDHFAARFTGTITIPEGMNVYLKATSDDGSRIYIDDKLFVSSWKGQSTTTTTSETTLEGGRSYQIRFEYFDGTEGAVCRLEYQAEDPETCTRTVWIPEGEWMDVDTGDVISGPRTITVTKTVNETPMYVRMGSVVPLADEALTTADSDWSHLTLDVYPSQTQTDTSTIYEDDGESSAYEDGAFRTTTLTTGFEATSGSFLLDIAAAQGSFTGDRACTDRDWTLRVHQPAGWGELQSVTTADGKTLTFTKVEADSAAMPFETAGGAKDGAVYVVNFSASVDEASTLKLKFAGMDTQITDTGAAESTPKETDVDLQPVTAELTVAEVPESVNLTEEGDLDWMYVGAKNRTTVTRKDLDLPLIQYTPQNGRTVDWLKHYWTTFSWSDGNTLPSNDGTTNAINITTYDYGAGSVPPMSLSFTVEAAPEARTLSLYIGGNKSTLRVEVVDESTGNVIQSQEIGTMDSSYYQRVSVAFQCATKTDLTVRVVRTSEEDPSSKSGGIYLAAATLSSKAADIAPIRTGEVERTVVVTEEMPAAVNLTEEGTADWLHTGLSGAGTINRKAGVDPLIQFRCTQTEMAWFYDYATKFSWTDGNPTVSTGDTQTGSHCNVVGEYMEFTVPADQTERVLTLYIGGYMSSGKLQVFDDSTGTEIQEYEFSNQLSSYYRKVQITLSAETAGTLRVRYTLLSGNNITFTAATLTGDPVSTRQIGDVNDDGFINSSDARLVLQHTVSLITLTGEDFRCGDVNSDNRLNSSDARWILQKSVGLVS